MRTAAERQEVRGLLALVRVGSDGVNNWRARVPFVTTAMLVLGLVIAVGAIGKPLKKDGLAETRRTLEVRTRTLGVAHPDTLEVMRELAKALHNSRITEYRREGFALDQKLKTLYAQPRGKKQPRTKPQPKQPHGVGESRAKPALNPAMRSSTGTAGLVRLPQPKRPERAAASDRSFGTGERRAKLQPGFKPSFSAKRHSPAGVQGKPAALPWGPGQTRARTPEAGRPGPTARAPQPPSGKQPVRKEFPPAAASHARAQYARTLPQPPSAKQPFRKKFLPVVARSPVEGIPPPRPPRLRRACAPPHHVRPVEMMNCSADGNIERRRWCIHCVLS